MKATVKKCIDCLSKIPAEARKCAHCGSVQTEVPNMPKKQGRTLIAALLFIFISGVLLYGAWTDMGTTTSSSVYKQNQQTVANDFERQYYDVVKYGGSGVEKCVKAGLVAEGYLQAGDQVKYAKWNFQRIQDCDAAGVPI